MISIVTGTLNRRHLLPIIIDNTVDNCCQLELVLVDGGSEDGTVEYLKSLNHPKIKLIEVGHRSSYSHFMNLGIRASSHEYICQWNDDAFLLNKWEDVISSLGEEDLYLFSWRYDTDNEWIIYCDFVEEVCMNYGIYKKDVFRKYGMYSDAYRYYCADGDMSYRAWVNGCKVKILRDIQVVVPKKEDKKAIIFGGEYDVYAQRRKMYKAGGMPRDIEYLI
jgi:glycosyltransferase involved in cell wall biosynthesis